MKAIILAAGEGKRLRPLTEKIPKCLVKYQRKPIIDYQLEAMRSCCIEDIVLVKGYKADVLHRAGVRSLVNPQYAITNMVYSLFCAEKELMGDVVVSYGDIIYGKESLQALIDCSDDFAITIDVNWRQLWSKRMANPLADAETMKLDRNGYVIELGKKATSYDEIQGQYMGLIKIGEHILERIVQFYHDLDREGYYDGKDFNNMYMTSFLQMCLEKVAPLKAVPIMDNWLEIDSIEDLTVSI